MHGAVAWLMLSRATFMPVRIASERFSYEEMAGPIVATIFARRMGASCRQY